ncbi:MAG: imidazolonepropionase [Bacteroidetes bacterium CHB5]|nr:imidazolonepropionase [Bacteroidetes bacterium CHB5]
MCDILITHIHKLVQVREQALDFVHGSAMRELPSLENAYLVIAKGQIADFGLMKDLPAFIKATTVIDAAGRLVLPSFVDSHTHLVFADTREEEFVLKLKGATYQQIAAAGGGILNSARKLQQTSEEELLEKALVRAAEVIKTGTGAIEIKSGYGLTIKDELKMLRVARKIGVLTPLTVKTTLLGAHAVPKDKTKEQYIEEIIAEMIPAAAEGSLADYIDVFCETGFFSPDETERIAEAGKQHGLIPRLHANQLNRSGGVQVGVKTKAISVDHLENIGEEEIQALKGSLTMPVSLPGAAFFLGLPFTPARQIIDSGLPLGIATDYNPGSAPGGSMPFNIALACIKMRMLPEEAINAATINTAYTLGLSHTHATITKGKVANIIITRPMRSVAAIPYGFCTNPVSQVILNGKIISDSK